MFTLNFVDDDSIQTQVYPQPVPLERRRGMSHQGNPWDIPEWHSIRREAALVRQLVGSGVTALGRASYADNIGEYYVALFGLSVGLERLAKPTLVADQAISNGGTMPDQQIVRRFGHKLTDLINAIDGIVNKYSLKLVYPRPSNATSGKIIECLDAFADASRGRYANFAALGDPNLGQEEPSRGTDTRRVLLRQTNSGASGRSGTKAAHWAVLSH